MRSTNYKQDISGLYKYDKNKLYISLNDALAYVNWMNIKYKEQLPLNYVFALPNKTEMVRAIVLNNLKYSKNEFFRDAMDDNLSKLRGSLSVGDIRLALVPLSGV